ncbi:outer membrane protein assembly factor BamB family protein [Nakamurella endophytica]|uniref:Pyrrolo-quinoline quinone repeat domain-containing protein n=1 Tax=Nakamurella endophytica TaxID=1748367 RepID=A0A917SP43_9ACTN|nr:PQQ-binding-like beta-propeller repeat protein [Nakamurella endophytica]GGL88784.1 hypothetical protein GCM10011594_05520 [Nakamurella endophytica]
MRFLRSVALVLVALVATTAAGWPTNHGDNRRTGYDPTAATYRGLRTAFGVPLDGAVYGSPIVVGSTVVVATENNSVYALDAGTGRIRWRHHLRTAVTDTGYFACPGNIRPSGITGTPAYDAATGRVFVVTVTPVGSGSGRTVHHEIWGLRLSDGGTAMNRRVEVPGTDPRAEQQRAALATANGNVYIAFGGLAGDCGDYKGAVISLRTNGALGGVAYVVPTTREAGIWAPGGPVVAADGSVYVAVGNGESRTSYDYSDSVTRLSPSMQRLDYYSPTTWAHDNEVDADLGSMSPALTGNGFVLQAGKSGTGYVLRQNRLGHVGGQVSQGSLCRAFGVSAVTGSTVYMPCTDGVSRVEVSSAGTFRRVWRNTTGITSSPVAGPGALYATGGSRLYALNPRTGTVLGSADLGSSTLRFTTPALSGNKAYVGTTAGVVAVTIG